MTGPTGPVELTLQRGRLTTNEGATEEWRSTAEGAWVVECVATRSEYRRRGLVDALLGAELDRGRQQGFTVAQISLLIGNEPVWRLHEGFGFHREALFRAHVKKHGVATDVVGLGLLRGDWAKRRETSRERLRSRGFDL